MISLKKYSGVSFINAATASRVNKLLIIPAKASVTCFIRFSNGRPLWKQHWLSIYLHHYASNHGEPRLLLRLHRELVSAAIEYLSFQIKINASATSTTTTTISHEANQTGAYSSVKHNLSIFSAVMTFLVIVGIALQVINFNIASFLFSNVYLE